MLKDLRCVVIEWSNLPCKVTDGGIERQHYLILYLLSTGKYCFSPLGED